MAIKPTSTPLTLPTFDFTALSSFYGAGGSLSLATRRATLETQGIKSLSGYDPAVIPPWELRQPDPGDESDRLAELFRKSKAIGLRDPLDARNGDNEAFQNLFALYRGLGRLRELATYAETGRSASLYAKMLNGRFQDMLREIRGFADGLDLPGIALISGIRIASVESAIATPKPLEKTLPVHYGAILTSARDEPIPGIGASDGFTLTVETATRTEAITVDFSDIAGTLTVDNVVAHINEKLADAGVLSRLATERHSETSYGLRIDIANGEKLSFAAAPGSARPAIYVAGTSGVGDGSGGFLRKLENLDGGTPTEAFYTSIATDAADDARAVAVDSQGYVYVVGTSAGDLGGQVNQGTPDAYLRKYDAAGQLVWSRLLGANTEAAGFAVAVDADGAVIVAGQTRDRLTSTAYGGNLDAFVTKYDSDGRELWTRQAAPYADDAGLALATDGDGNIFLAGYANAPVDAGISHAGSADATVVKLASDGSTVWSKQFGGAGNDYARAVAVDGSGNVYVAAERDGRAVVRKYADGDQSQDPIWEADLGPFADGDAVSGIAIGSDGAIYVAGSTGNPALAGTVVQAHSGGRDGFVARLDAAGTVDWVSYVGTGADEGAFGLTVRTDSGADEIYLTGSTAGALGGRTPSGSADGFVARLDDTGATLWVEQFGGVLGSRGAALAFDPAGTDVISRLGLPKGPIPASDVSEVVNQTSARAGVSFAIQVNGGAPRRVMLEAGDSYGFLAFKINRILGSSGFASVKSTAEGMRLQIEARNGGRIDLLAGPTGFDALAPLGLKPATLFAKTPETGDADADKDDGVYALGFFDGLNLLDKAPAAEAGIIIDNAMRALRNAYERLNPSPKLTDPLAGVNISEADRSRIAALQLGLANITAINQQLRQGSLVSVTA